MLNKSRSISVLFRIRLIGILGILFCLIGISGIVLSIVELFHGRPNVYHYNEALGGLKIENPLWPSSGKGFWVGLIMVATGLVGILASYEWTPPSLIGFTTLSGVSTILSFYMIITCIIPVQNDTKYSDTSRPSWQLNELILNSLLIAVGGCGAIIGSISTLIGSYVSGCCANKRATYSDNDEPSRIIIIPSRTIGYGLPKV